MPYYVVLRVRALVRGGPSGPDLYASRVLDHSGFEPNGNTEPNGMNEGAIPKSGNVIVRFESEHAKWFKLIRVEKVKKKASLIEIDAGKITSAQEGDVEMTLVGVGKKLQWEITCTKRRIHEQSLNIRGEIVYDNNRARRSEKTEIKSNGEQKPVEVTSVEVEDIDPEPSTNPGPPPVEPIEGRVAARESGEEPEGKILPKPRFPSPIPNLNKERASLSEGFLQIEVNDINNGSEEAAAPVPVMELGIKEYIAKAKISEITPDPHQPREYFDEAKLHDMAESMKAEAQVVFIIVRLIPEGTDGKRFMIIDGERRFRAAQYAGINELLVVVRPHVGESTAFRQSVIANFNRMEHTVSENLKVIKRLITDGCTVAETCAICGKSPAWYYHHMAFEHLHPDILRLIDPPTEKKNRVPSTLAHKIAYLPMEEQKSALHRIRQEPSARARSELADELAQPYMPINSKRKPSRELRSLERFALLLRGFSRSSFLITDVAARALVLNRDAKKVEALVADVDESMQKLRELRSVIERTQKEVALR